MDPNLMKFLEEDEDETLHSGADVDAFTAQLNRDIEGANSQHSSDSAHTDGQFLPQWHTSATDGVASFQSGQAIIATEQRADQQSSQLMLQRHDSDSFGQKEEEGFSHDTNSLRFPNPQDNQNSFAVSQPIAVAMQTTDQESKVDGDAHLQNLKNMSAQNTQSMVISSNNQQSTAMESNEQKMLPMGSGNQQTSIGNQDMAAMNQQHTGMGMNSQQSTMSGTGSLQQPGGASMRNKQVPFGMLLPIIQPQLDKDRAMQLQTLYLKLKKNEITKDDFVRHMRSIVGDQMLKMAVYKLQTQAAKQQSANRFQPPNQPPARQPQVPSTGTNPSLQMPTNLTNSSNTINSREMESKADLQGAQGSQMPTSSLNAFSQDRKHPVFPSAINKQQPHFQQSSFPAYGSSYQPFSAASSPPVRAQAHDSQIRQPTPHQSMNYVKQEPLDHSNEQHRVQFSSAPGPSSLSHVKQGTGTQGNLMDESFEMHSSRMRSTPPSNMSNPRMTSLTPNVGPPKAPPKKPLVGPKKPMETPGSSPPSSKKQKPSGGSMDQSIEQLNDVTAVSGVNLREEEEQLFSGSKEDSRISEISRRIVQEEEEKLILQKIPLQKKVMEIIAESGLKSMGSDVERCLSLCVEERLRGLITNLVRMSKQRVDMEKPRHRTIITSDVKQQIATINRKAREESEKKQAETDKSLDPEGAAIGEGDKEKDEARLKSAKANKEEDDKMRATAANVAVRAATGVGDMLSRWQLMFEANQKQGGGTDSTSSSPGSLPSGKDVAQKPLSISSTRNTKESREPEKRVPLNASASVRKAGRNQVAPRRVARSITVKDVISVLEREPQMSKSMLLYRLYSMASAADAPSAND